ncbi:hypothetical protein D3C78_1569890 [compost metagenome]
MATAMEIMSIDFIERMILLVYILGYVSGIPLYIMSGIAYVCVHNTHIKVQIMVCLSLTKHNTINISIT